MAEKPMSSGVAVGFGLNLVNQQITKRGRSYLNVTVLYTMSQKKL